jgi:C-terminal processing protease CtpA/Prc
MGMVGVAYPAGGLPASLAAGPLTARPVALLVNRSTASASEVLAGE